MSTINTFGLSGRSPLSSQPKKSSAASSRALSVLVPPRMCGKLLALDLIASIDWASVNLENIRQKTLYKQYFLLRKQRFSHVRNWVSHTKIETCMKSCAPGVTGRELLLIEISMLRDETLGDWRNDSWKVLFKLPVPTCTKYALPSCREASPYVFQLQKYQVFQPFEL